MGHPIHLLAILSLTIAGASLRVAAETAMRSQDDPLRTAYSFLVPASAVDSFLQFETALDERPWDWAANSGGGEGYPTVEGEFLYYSHAGLGIWFGPFMTSADASAALGRLRVLTNRLRAANPARYGHARVMRFRGVGDDWYDRLLRRGGRRGIELRWLLDTMEGLQSLTILEDDLADLDALDGLSAEEIQRRLLALQDRIEHLELKASGETSGLGSSDSKIAGSDAIGEAEVVQLRELAGAWLLESIDADVPRPARPNGRLGPSDLAEIAVRLELALKNLGVPAQSAQDALAVIRQQADSNRHYQSQALTRALESAGAALLEHHAARAGLVAGEFAGPRWPADATESLADVFSRIRGAEPLTRALRDAARNANSQGDAAALTTGLHVDPMQSAFAAGRWMLEDARRASGLAEDTSDAGGAPANASTAPAGLRRLDEALRPLGLDSAEILEHGVAGGAAAGWIADQLVRQILEESTDDQNGGGAAIDRLVGLIDAGERREAPDPSQEASPVNGDRETDTMRQMLVDRIVSDAGVTAGNGLSGERIRQLIQAAESATQPVPMSGSRTGPPSGVASTTSGSGDAQAGGGGARGASGGDASGGGDAQGGSAASGNSGTRGASGGDAQGGSTAGSDSGTGGSSGGGDAQGGSTAGSNSGTGGSSSGDAQAGGGGARGASGGDASGSGDAQGGSAASGNSGTRGSSGGDAQGGSAASGNSGTRGSSGGSDAQGGGGGARGASGGDAQGGSAASGISSPRSSSGGNRGQRSIGGGGQGSDSNGGGQGSSGGGQQGSKGGTKRWVRNF